jgi:hypothetical protein
MKRSFDEIMGQLMIWAIQAILMAVCVLLTIMMIVGAELYFARSAPPSESFASFQTNTQNIDRCSGASNACGPVAEPLALKYFWCRIHRCR